MSQKSKRGEGNVSNIRHAGREKCLSWIVESPDASGSLGLGRPVTLEAPKQDAPGKGAFPYSDVVRRGAKRFRRIKPKPLNSSLVASGRNDNHRPQPNVNEDDEQRKHRH